MARFRRLLLICLLCLLPLQWGWAAAASLCAHESGVGAQHFGHHEHRHQEAGEQTGDADHAKQPIKKSGSNNSGPAGAVAGTDGDCASCHGQSLNAVLALPAEPALVLAERQASPYLQHLSQRYPEPALRPPHLTHLA